MILSDKMRSFLNSLADDIDFKKLLYYMRSMKKAPHGGRFCNMNPHCFLKYNCINSFYFMTTRERIPYPLLIYFENLDKIIKNYCITEEELLFFCFGHEKEPSTDPIWGRDLSSYKHARAMMSNTLTTKPTYTDYDREVLIMAAITKEIPFQKLFDCDHEQLIVELLKLILLLSPLDVNEYHGTNLFFLNSINDILPLERINVPHDKYGLSDITNAKFERQGFSIDDKYYLYNIFFDTSIDRPISSVPKTVALWKTIPDVKIYMRRDETLAVQIEKKVISASLDFEKWRGITLKLNDTFENQIKSGKNVIIHYDPDSFNKILIIIKRTVSNGEHYFDISVEQLWNPDHSPSEVYILTNFVHGCYYPSKNSFDHIDFSINQYSYDLYMKKWMDAMPETQIPIELYGERHYKIWCIRSDNISIDIWAHLVYCSLDSPFRKYFAEAIGCSLENIE